MILQLHPYDEYLSTITFVTTGITATNSGYYYQDNTLELNEANRLQVIYSEEYSGGKAIDNVTELVDVSFEAVVWGTTRAEMIQTAAALKNVVTNMAGGLLEYKPDDLTGISTFYKYEASSPPSMETHVFNNWNINPETGELKYAALFNINLRTHAIAFSDPDNRNTIYSGATYNGTPITVNSDMIIGDLPADVKLTVDPYGTTEDWVNFYIWSRSGANHTTSGTWYMKTSDAGDAYGGDDWAPETAPSTTWSQTTISRYTPSSLNQWDNYYFPIETKLWDGYHSVFVIGKPNSSASEWRGRLALSVDENVIWSSNSLHTPRTNKYHIFYVGDIHLPGVFNSEVYDSYDMGYLELVLQMEQISGTLSTFDLDAIVLVDNSLSSMQIEWDDYDGDYYLLNNLFLGVIDYTIKDDVQQVFIVDSGSFYNGAANIYGSKFIEVEPGKINRIVLMAERDSSATHRITTDDRFAITAEARYRTIYPFTQEMPIWV